MGLLALQTLPMLSSKLMVKWAFEQNILDQKYGMKTLADIALVSLTPHLTSNQSLIKKCNLTLAMSPP